MANAPYDAGEDRREAPSENHAASEGNAPTETLVAGTVGDRCVNCGAPLSSDQRYCVVCGERRGAPRFSLPAAAAQSAPSPAAPRPPRRPRLGQGPTLIAGVATLLLAMLVGVLIGHGIGGTGTKTVASAPVRIITTGGGSSAPAASSAGAGSTGSAGGSSTTPKKSKHSAASSTPKARKAAPQAAKKAAAKEQSAAKKVLGGSGTPPATVTVGAKGSGKGYSKKTHKFTGSFFGQ